MTTTDAKKLAAAGCHRAGNCAQACHGGFRVRRISDHAADAFATAVQAAALRQLQIQGNPGNLNNPAARGHGGPAAIVTRSRVLITRLLEFMVCTLDPKRYIDVCTHIPPANQNGNPRQLAGPPTVAYGSLVGLYKGMTEAMEMADHLFTMPVGQALPDEADRSPGLMGRNNQITRRAAFHLMRAELATRANGGIDQLLVQIVSFWNFYFQGEQSVDLVTKTVIPGRASFMDEFVNVQSFFNLFYQLRQANGSIDENFDGPWYIARDITQLRNMGKINSTSFLSYNINS